MQYHPLAKFVAVALTTRPTGVVGTRLVSEADKERVADFLSN